jgi:hypothetical protein
MKARIGELQEVVFARQWLVNKFLQQWINDTTIEELLDAVFSLQSMLRWYKEGQQQFSSPLIGKPVLNWLLEPTVSRCWELAVSSCSWGVTAGKDVCMEVEEYPLLGAATKQQAHEDTADLEDLAYAIVICRMHVN